MVYSYLSHRKGKADKYYFKLILLILTFVQLLSSTSKNMVSRTNSPRLINTSQALTGIRAILSLEFVFLVINQFKIKASSKFEIHIVT